jgi:uncharacterized protein (TIGR03083 family)
MTELADRSIVALRAHHDELAKVVSELAPEALHGPSGALEWTLAQVLSHLGSGAEITRATISASIPGTTAAEADNQSIWDRWNAASPQEQATWFVEHDEDLVAMLEALSPQQRESMKVSLGFLPEPVSLDVALGMRLNEVAAHAWDVLVGLDPEARMSEESAALLAEHFTGGLGFLLGFSGKADRLSQQAIVALDGYELVIDDAVRVVRGTSEGETARFSGPLESAIRLLSGRLVPEHTPAGVQVTGNVTLDELRQVFPGY